MREEERRRMRMKGAVCCCIYHMYVSELRESGVTARAPTFTQSHIYTHTLASRHNIITNDMLRKQLAHPCCLPTRVLFCDSLLSACDVMLGMTGGRRALHGAGRWEKNLPIQPASEDEAQQGRITNHSCGDKKTSTLVNDACFIIHSCCVFVL